MKATVSRKELQEALAIAGAASSVRSSLPTYMSTLIRVRDGKLELVGCDGEMWAKAIIPARIEEEGEACVQQKFLAEIVGALAHDEVRLEHTSGTLVLYSGPSEWKLMSMDTDMFPPMPEVPATSEVRLKMGLLREAINAVSYAVSEDHTRELLTGVNFQYDGETLTLVATDTHRLAVCRIEQPGIGSEIKVVVPEKALRIIKSLPVADDEEVTLRFDDVRISVDVGTAAVVSQLLNGTFPNWERVVPTEYTRQWTLDRKQFVDNLKRMTILARDNSHRVKLAGQGDTVVITAQSGRGEAREEVSVLSENGDLEIAFNVRYILDALGSMPGEGVRVQITEASRGTVFRPVEKGENQFCVIMPMALN